MANCRNHYDLLEMAVRESLPLRQFLSSYNPNHLAPIEPWQGKRTVETAPPARSGKSAKEWLYRPCTASFAPKILKSRRPVGSSIVGRVLRRYFVRAKLWIVPTRAAHAFLKNRCRRGSIRNRLFQANGKDGPDRGGKQQVPLPVPGSRCTGTEPLARRAARTGSQGVA